jgi:hypothetical protein
VQTNEWICGDEQRVNRKFNQDANQSQAEPHMMSASRLIVANDAMMMETRGDGEIGAKRRQNGG